MAKYWVGGTGNTSDATNHWATISGGTPGAGNTPTAADDLIFDANSGSGTVTINAALTGRSLQTTGSTVTTCVHNAFTVTLGDATAGTGNVALDVSGFSTYTLSNAATSAYTFASTSATVQTIKTGGRTLGNLTFQGVGSKYQLADNLTIGATATLTHTNGQLDLNAKTVSVGTYSVTGSLARTLIFNGAALTCTGAGTTSWNATTTTNLTFTPDTGSITLTGTGSTVGATVFAGGGLTYNNVTFSGSFGLVSMTGANTFANLTITGAASTTNEVRLGSNITVTSTITLNGNSVANRGLLRSSVIGTSRTVTAATVTSNGFFDLMDLTGAGTGTWSNSGWGVLGVTSITGATPVTTYWVGGTGNISDATKYSSTDGGTANTQRAPLMQDTAIFNANSGSGTLTLDLNRFGSLDFTNTALTSVTKAGGFLAEWWCGDLIAPSITITWTGLADTLAFVGRGSQTLNAPSTTNWAKDNGLSINTTGTYTLAGNLTTTGNFTLTLGTFTASTYNVSALTYTLSAGTLNMGSGNWTISSQAAVTAWTETSATINAQTSSILWTNTSANAQTFAGGGATYYNLVVSATGAGVHTFTGSNTFNALSISGIGTKTIKFTSATTTTLTSTQPNCFFSGTTANLITISSVTAASAFTLSSSTKVSTNFISLKDSTAAGTGNPFYAGDNSTNVSGNTNWTFTDYPHSPGNNLTMMGVG